MKRFQFSLNTVLSYKQQVLEELQNEHGQLLYQVSMRAACAFWRMRSSGRPSACGSMRPQRRRSVGR